MKGTIRKRLYEKLYRDAEGATIQEARIGIGYVGVCVREDHLGLAALLLNELPAGCSRFAGAGSLTGAPALNLLPYLMEGTNPLERALGLATANGLLHPAFIEMKEENALDLMQLTPADRVAMVGLFPPLVQRIEATGAALSIIERNPARMTVPVEKKRLKILRSCTVAIVTATTLLNDTLEETLQSLDSPRHVALLGPSTPLCMDAFADTPVTHLGGSVVLLTRKVLQIISEGGGTPEMRPHLRFVNLLKERKE